MSEHNNKLLTSDLNVIKLYIMQFRNCSFSPFLSCVPYPYQVDPFVRSPVIHPLITVKVFIIDASEHGCEIDMMIVIFVYVFVAQDSHYVAPQVQTVNCDAFVQTAFQRLSLRIELHLQMVAMVLQHLNETCKLLLAILELV